MTSNNNEIQQWHSRKQTVAGNSIQQWHWRKQWAN